MRLLGTITAAVLILAAPAASAADLLTVPVSTEAALAVAGSGFDWTGFYAGVYGVGQSSAVAGLQYGLGIDLGVTAQFEFILVGAEVAFRGLTGGAGSTSYVQGLGKVGLAITDGFVAYGALGAGLDVGPAAESDVLLGGGLEFAVTDDVSLRAQYLHGFPITGANPKDEISVGANFHF